MSISCHLLYRRHPSIIYSQALRLRKICTQDSDCVKHITHLTQHHWHGYSIEHMHTTNTKSIHTTENRMPQVKTKSNHTHTNILLVIPYYPALPSVHDITNNWKQILHLSLWLISASPTTPIIAYSRPKKKSQRPIGKGGYITQVTQHQVTSHAKLFNKEHWDSKGNVFRFRLLITRACLD